VGKKSFFYLPSKTPDKRNKLVQILCTKRTDHRSEQDQRKSEKILHPLDLHVALSTLGEQTILDNPDGGEKL